jgi:hypothetical protein
MLRVKFQAPDQGREKVHHGSSISHPTTVEFTPEMERGKPYHNSQLLLQREF